MQICIILTLIVTMYAPGAGGINGGLRGGYDRVGGQWVGGVFLNNAHAACGFSYHFGTTFEILDERARKFLEDAKQPVTRVCADRGGLVRDQNLDLVSPSLSLAYKWGRRLVPVRICPVQTPQNPNQDMSKYHAPRPSSNTPR